MAIKFVGGPRHGQDLPVWEDDGRPVMLVDGESVGDSGGKNQDVPQHRYNRQSWCDPSGQLMAYYAADGMSDDEMNEGARALMGGESKQ